MAISSFILRRRIEEALALLEGHQGQKRWPGYSEPLDCLLLTVLSQNTNDNLRDLAYRRLRSEFGSWREVLEASTDDIQTAIKVGGLSHQKAARIVEILRWVRAEFGELSLAALAKLDDDAALELLTSRKGVGIKTAAVVMMAALGRDLCPVDTHVHRIAKRLGWVDDGISAERTFWQLRPHVPKGKGYSLHMNLLDFGKALCQARKPRCDTCFLWDLCLWEGKLAASKERQIVKGDG